MGACTENKKNVWNKASLECFALIICENGRNADDVDSDSKR